MDASVCMDVLALIFRQGNDVRSQGEGIFKLKHKAERTSEGASACVGERQASVPGTRNEWSLQTLPCTCKSSLGDVGMGMWGVVSEQNRGSKGLMRSHPSSHARREARRLPLLSGTQAVVGRLQTDLSVWWVTLAALLRRG